MDSMKNWQIKSLKARFFLFFTGLGIIVALGVGIVMYVQDAGYIKDSYRGDVDMGNQRGEQAEY
jgi:uncharacterized protein YraI